MGKINTNGFVRATRSTLWEINREIVLNLVREHQPISRADRARRRGISRGMVTTLMSELLEAGELYEGASADAPRGRRPKMLCLRTRNRFGIAIDIRFSQTFLMLGDSAAHPALRSPSTPSSMSTNLVDELGSGFADCLVRTASPARDQHLARSSFSGVQPRPARGH